MSKNKITDKKPLTVSFKNIVIQLGIIVFFTIIWLNAPLFGTGALNIGYFLFMFIGVVISGVLTLYSKANPDQPIPKKPTQQFTNLVKVMTDIITNHIGVKEAAGTTEIKDIIQKALVWSLREAKISPEFDRSVLEEAETYIFDKLFPEEKKEGEQESPSTG
jgi:hypothetical protein